jgi:uncharacterized protein YdcH (DUF465 family)
MASLPHQLREEFPSEASLIERLVRSNYRFRRLVERYDDINREIDQGGSEENSPMEQINIRLKKRRSKIKNDIAAILAQVAARMKPMPSQSSIVTMPRQSH